MSKQLDDELKSKLRWITSNQLEEGDYDQIVALISEQVREARIDELDKKLPSVIGYDVLWANPKIMQSVSERIAQLSKKGAGDE